jgi:hypothetical protein
MDTIIAHYPPHFPPANCMLIRVLKCPHQIWRQVPGAKGTVSQELVCTWQILPVTFDANVN